MAISANQNSNLTELPNSMAEWVVWAGAEVGMRQGAGPTVVICEDESSGAAPATAESCLVQDLRRRGFIHSTLGSTGGI